MAPQPKEIAAGVYWLQTFWANVYLVRSGASWALIDTGMPKCGRLIQDAAVSLFGAVRAASILLGHFHEDHAGSALVLSREWSVPIYVHRDELPFVTGTPALLVEPPKKPDPPVGRFMLPLGVLIMLSQDVVVLAKRNEVRSLVVGRSRRPRSADEPGNDLRIT